jgi:hypothetical protein
MEVNLPLFPRTVVFIDLALELAKAILKAALRLRLLSHRQALIFLF